jgi:hypothetical protein
MCAIVTHRLYLAQVFLLRTGNRRAHSGGVFLLAREGSLVP